MKAIFVCDACECWLSVEDMSEYTDPVEHIRVPLCPVCVDKRAAIAFAEGYTAGQESKG